MQGEFQDWNLGVSFDGSAIGLRCRDMLACEAVAYCNAVKEAAIDRVENEGEAGVMERVEMKDFDEGGRRFGEKEMYWEGGRGGL